MNDNIISPVSGPADREALAKAKEFIASNKKHVQSWYDPKLQAHIATTRSEHFFHISDIIKR